jgi:hypothetical protein
MFKKMFSEEQPLTPSRTSSPKARDPFCSDALNARLRILLIKKHTLTKKEFKKEKDALFKEILKN